jgi:glycosyltransferase involved in cell wall biosynthesis
MKISVALCTYNGSRFLQEQLESFTKQSRSPDEVVIVDDRSNDDTVAIAKAFARTAEFPISILENEANLGSTGNFEKAISLCSGDIIALSDQDDIWMPEKLERLESIFTSDPSVGMVFSDAVLVDERLVPIGIRLWAETFRPRDRAAFAAGRASKVLLQYNVVTGATMSFRRTLASAILPIPQLMGFIHDAWIALVASLGSRVVALDEKLVLYRQHTGQQLGAGLSRWEIARSDRYQLTLEDRRQAINRLDDFRDIIDEGFLKRLRRIAPDPEIVPSAAVFTSMLSSARKNIEEHIVHISARLALPPERHLRLLEIVGEMATGRYATFSRGWQSAALDLVRK